MRITDQITEKLMRFVVSGTTDIVIPNYYVGKHEMDVCKIMKNGLIVEYEVKVSKADFKKDFEKGRKHLDMIDCISPCNRFYFVCPKGLITLKDVPTYAGLITYNEGGSWYGEHSYLTVVKVAPLIHKNRHKLNYHSVATNLFFRERNKANKIKALKEELAELRKSTTIV